MDNITGASEKPYIWLRYTTQFTSGGRTHTIEMGIPMPVGANAETREQLIREAEAGMDQLSRHVENRVTQLLQRNARPQSTTPAFSNSTTSMPSAPQAINRPPASSTSTPTPATTPPAAQSSSREAPPSSEKRETVPPVRANAGVNMPHSPNLPGEVTGNMSLAQFMHFIRENWSLTPKQAMELLNVKTLHGLNLRDALKQLQPLVARDSNDMASTSDKKPAETNSPKTGEHSTPGSPSSTSPGRSTSPGSTPAAQPAPTPIRSASNATSTPVATTSRSSPVASTRPPSNSAPPTSRSTNGSTPAPGKATPSSEPPAQLGNSRVPIIPIHSGMVRDAHSAYRFVEEDDKELDLDLEEEDYDIERLRAQAQDKLDKLKEAGGSAAANPARLTALQNVIGEQISETQLQKLIHAAWGAASLKKLKVDQAEALISWAKEDEFEGEAKAVLALVEEEESYASSDW